MRFIFLALKAIVLAVLNLLFFKILIKIYYNYILIYKKVKEINKKHNSSLYLIKKNSPILIIMILVSAFVLSGRIERSKAQNLSDQIHKTTLAKNIKSELTDSDYEELIVETLVDKNLTGSVPDHYLNEVALLKTQPQIGPKTDSDYVLNFEHGDALSGYEINDSNGSKRNEIVEYIVQSGDTVSDIAANFALNVNTILWENNLSASSLIKPGAKLSILPGDGIRHTVAKNETLGKLANTYGVSAEVIAEANDLAEGEALKIGQKLFIPGGKKIVSSGQAVNRTYSGTTITQNTAGSANQQVAYTGGKLLWPTVGTKITQYYSWSHKGLDIANKTGTPLYAAESGTVERSGWSNGYGYNVVINHGGGLKTLYGHASKLHVKTGDKVNRGDIIADMGSTGWSTGPHIHFEVIINGVKQNPLNYIR